MTKHSMDIKYSIIIPTYNRAEILQRCLQCICELENPVDGCEVLAFNNNSTDSTEEIVNSYMERLSNLRYFRTTNPGLHVGRNLGYDKAKGKILCYIDDDSFVSKGWLKGVEKAFQDPEVVLVGGPCLPEYEVEPPGWLSKMWSSTTEEGRTLGSLSLIDVGDKQRWISPYYVYGCNFSIRKDILAEIGGFHPDAMPKEVIHYRGDGKTFVFERLIESGYTAVYSPGAKIHHFVPASRMTTDYFCHRLYIQGISDSYTATRRAQGRLAEVRPKSLLEKVREKPIQKIPHAIWGRMKWFMSACVTKGARSISSQENSQLMIVRREIALAHKAGYRYHQEEVRKDPKLLEWVLRENYLGENGRLP